MIHPVPASLLFDQLADALARRHAGMHSPAPDWLDPDAVEALSLPLGGAAAPSVCVVLRDGVSARSLPRRVGTRDGTAGLALRCVRGRAARGQAGPPTLQAGGTAEGGSFGTATALVRDRLAPERNYLLTCAHVLAPDEGARFDAPFTIDMADGNSCSGTLCEWTPALGRGCPASALDAGLLEVDAPTTLALRRHQAANDWLPDGVSDAVAPNKPVTLRRPGGPLQASLVVRWSGRVDVGGDGYPDYFLRNAIGYVTHGGVTQGGDSGSPVWTEASELIGMHLAGIAPESAFGASGVMGRVAPVLDWFRVKPYTRLDPATLDSGLRPGATARRVEPVNAVPLRLGAEAVNARIVLAQTLWGEARGEQEIGMHAVACVIVNRVRKRHRGRASVTEVCLDPKQFSCWNLDDPSRAALDRVPGRPDAAFATALALADLALTELALDPRAAPRALPDLVDGARHYIASTLRQRPDWLHGQRPCAVIGRHEFFRDID
ncbi:MAG: cell wall hydrolase [Piscinibacter sp.]|nr:cell wall hydrolase [Piscinibacter sp.]